MPRTLIALLVAAFGVGAAVFGVVRGLSVTGPASGFRLHVSIAPPLDADTVALAARVVRLRIDDNSGSTRVAEAGDRLVVELGDVDTAAAAETAALIERRGALEVRVGDANGAEVLDPSAIRRAEVSSGGVDIALRRTSRVTQGDQLAFFLDRKPHGTARADLVRDGGLHVTTSDDAALALVAVLETGAAPALHVESQEPFTRATGFWPRAWPFFAACGVMLVIAAVIARRR